MRIVHIFVLITLTSLIISCNASHTATKQSVTEKQIDSLLVKQTFKASNGLKMPYRFFSPKNSDKNKKPLVIFLHGRGDRGSDNSPNIYREFGFVTNPNSLVSQKTQAQYPSYILVPQCSDKTENEEWAKWIDNSPETPFKGLKKDGSYIMNSAPSESGLAAIELIEMIMATNNIDSNRIYIIGLSMGGFGTWEFVARKPQLFAAAVPMAGYSDPSQIDKIKHIPFWIFHGSIDKWNPVEGSRNMYQLLSEKNADVKYTEYKNTTHSDAFKKAFNENQLMSWMFSKSK